MWCLIPVHVCQRMGKRGPVVRAVVLTSEDVCYGRYDCGMLTGWSEHSASQYGRRASKTRFGLTQGRYSRPIILLRNRVSSARAELADDVVCLGVSEDLCTLLVPKQQVDPGKGERVMRGVTSAVRVALPSFPCLVWCCQSPLLLGGDAFPPSLPLLWCCFPNLVVVLSPIAACGWCCLL